MNVRMTLVLLHNGNKIAMFHPTVVLYPSAFIQTSMIKESCYTFEKIESVNNFIYSYNTFMNTLSRHSKSTE